MKKEQFYWMLAGFVMWLFIGFCIGYCLKPEKKPMDTTRENITTCLLVRGRPEIMKDVFDDSWVFCHVK